MTDVDRLQLIRQRCDEQAAKLDGMPFDGATVGTQFGNVLAAIDALAAILERHLETKKEGE